MATRPSTRRSTPRERGIADLRRHAAAAGSAPTSASGRSSPTATRSRRFLDSLAAFEALPADTLVLPSHGLPFRGIALRVAQLRAHHAARLDELVAAIAAGPAAACPRTDLVPVLFRRPLDLQQRFFAMGEAIAHLNHLWRAGRLDARTAPAMPIAFTLRAR